MPNSTMPSSDTIFEKERLFKTQEHQKRGTDFLESKWYSKIIMNDLVKFLFSNALIGKKEGFFPFEKIPLLGKNDNSKNDAKIFYDRIKKIGVNEITPR